MWRDERVWEKSDSFRFFYILGPKFLNLSIAFKCQTFNPSIHPKPQNPKTPKPRGIGCRFLINLLQWIMTDSLNWLELCLNMEHSHSLAVLVEVSENKVVFFGEVVVEVVALDEAVAEAPLLGRQQFPLLHRHEARFSAFSHCLRRKIQLMLILHITLQLDQVEHFSSFHRYLLI